MSLLSTKDIAEYLQQNSIGEVGVDLFGELPLDKKDAIGIVASPSPAPDKAIEVYEQVFDVWARFAKAEDGMARMQQVFDLYHRRQNYQLNDFHVYLSFAGGTIDDLDRDPEQQHLYKLSLSFVYRND